MGKTSHHRSAQRVEKTAAEIRAKTADSFTNLTARLGFGAGSQQDGSKYRVDFISRNPYNLEAAYRSNWICGMVVDIVAEDMTRAGIDLQSDKLKPDDQKQMHEAFERLRIWDALCKGLKWGRLYGGGVVVMLIDGHDLSTPLLLDRVGKDQFKGLLALDRWQVTPSLENLVTEYGPDLGKPKFYVVNTSAEALIGERIHYSRVLRIDGLELPWRQRLAENGWGQSVLERLWDRVVAFDSTTEGAAQLVYKAHLRTMKVEGLRELVAMGGKPLEGLIAQMNMMRQFQSNEGVSLMDAKDTFETHTYTFAGLSDMLLQFGEQLSGATQIPLVRLFGQSPAGMNATGESDWRTYYDNVSQQQDQKLRPGLRKINELVFRSEFGQDFPEGFGFEFAALWQMSDKEKADTASVIVDAVTKAADAGLIAPATGAKELRQASRATGVFTHIGDEEITELENEPPVPGDVDPLVADPKNGGKPASDKDSDPLVDDKTGSKIELKVV